LIVDANARSSDAMSSLAIQRLAIERKAWRKDHPHGFVARPVNARDGSVNMLIWECKIPGKAGTLWESGLFPVTMYFTEDYPSKPPKVSLPAGFFHPNVYPSGKVCLSILNEEKGWKPTITVKQILTGVQELLDNPNNADAAQDVAYKLYKKSKAEYSKRVRIEAARYTETATGGAGGGGGGTNANDAVVIL
jgi:ubiquitin-conjugating enzyme E2 I